jgi:hypothetical protein
MKADAVLLVIIQLNRERLSVRDWFEKQRRKDLRLRKDVQGAHTKVACGERQIRVRTTDLGLYSQNWAMTNEAFRSLVIHQIQSPKSE